MKLKISVSVEGDYDPEQLLGEGQAAEFLGCSRASLIHMREHSKIGPRHLRLDFKIFYRLQDLLEWAEGRASLFRNSGKRAARKLPENVVDFPRPLLTHMMFEGKQRKLKRR